MKFFPDFNQLQVDLLVGTLLGDGNLQNVGQSWRYRVLQKTAHIDYVNFKYGILKDFVNTPPKIQQMKDKNGKETSRCVFNTLSSPNFDIFANLFYKKNTENTGWIKQVPENISTYLTPTAVAQQVALQSLLGEESGERACSEASEVSRCETRLLASGQPKRLEHYATRRLRPWTRDRSHRRSTGRVSSQFEAWS